MAQPKRTNRRPRVIVANEHGPTRSGASAVLVESGYDVVEQCSSTESLLAAAQARRPDICLISAASRAGRLPVIAGVAALDPPPRVVVLASSVAIDDVLAVFDAGAVGYLLDDVPRDRLPLHLDDVGQGHLAVSPALVEGLVARARAMSTPHPAKLTFREQEVMRLLSGRLTTKQVAEQLAVSPTTVRRHASSAARKLGAADRGAAIQQLENVQGREREVGRTAHCLPGTTLQQSPLGRARRDRST